MSINSNNKSNVKNNLNLTGGLGSDTVTGGSGNDTLSINGKTVNFGNDPDVIGVETINYNGDDVNFGYEDMESKSSNNTGFGNNYEFTFPGGTGKITNNGNNAKGNNVYFGFQALNGNFGSEGSQGEDKVEGAVVTTTSAFSGKRNVKNKKNKLISLGKGGIDEVQLPPPPPPPQNNSGFHQTAFGKNTLSKSSGNSNTAFGTESGTSITNGKRNTLIGNSTDISEENGLAQLVIGYGAEGHGNYIGVLGGFNTDEKSSDQTALKAIIPSVDNYTNLGSSDYRYKELFVNKLNNGKEYTLPTESDINKDDLMISNTKGKLSFNTLDKFKGFYVERTERTVKEDNQRIKSSNGVASLSVGDIINSQGRIYLDANTTSIKFTSSAKDFIKKLGLTEDYDFTSNLYIFTESTDFLGLDKTIVTVSDPTDITLTFDSGIYSTKDFGDLKFSNNNTRLVIRKLIGSTIEIHFSD
tara:strand:- start:1474 stop:2880 length:1407 start_codon:yes stop_codon:yes gene_type:complete